MSDENENSSEQLGQHSSPPFDSYFKQCDENHTYWGMPASSTPENPDPNRFTIHGYKTKGYWWKGKDEEGDA